MKSKLLKIGSLLTFLSVLFVQLDLIGDENNITYTHCFPPEIDSKSGMFKEQQISQACEACEAGDPHEVLDDYGNVIGYGYTIGVVETNVSASECVTHTISGHCNERRIETMTAICTPGFVPIETGTAGTGTGTF